VTTVLFHVVQYIV